MRISVSLRIFLGFIAVLVAFGGVSVFHIVRTQEVQQELERLNKVYLRLGDVYRGLDTRVTQLSLLHRNLGDLIKTAGGSRSGQSCAHSVPFTQSGLRDVSGVRAAATDDRGWLSPACASNLPLSVRYLQK